MQLYTFIIPEDIGQVKLMGLAQRMLPQVPFYAIRQAFDKRDVKMNGVRVSRDAQALAGATVQLYLPPQKPREALRVVYQDERVLVVFKPVGVSCEGDEKGGLTIGQLARETLLAPDAPEPLPCHRLDNQTDGLLLLAKDERTQALLMDGFRARQVHKQYQCVVRGTPSPGRAVLEGYLRKDAKRARVWVTPHPAPGALPIQTGYTVLRGGETARLLIDLYTGRTHQIRAQMAAIGHPVVGDDEYGDRALNKALRAKRLMLTSVSLSFSLEGEMSYLNSVHLSVEPKF